jgi:hypothetical protein
MSAHGKVTTWYMTPEQLAEYIKKHPIRPIEPPKTFKVDYKWRGKKGAQRRWGHGTNNDLY